MTLFHYLYFGKTEQIWLALAALVAAVGRIIATITKKPTLGLVALTVAIIWGVATVALASHDYRTEAIKRDLKTMGCDVVRVELAEGQNGLATIKINGQSESDELVRLAGGHYTVAVPYAGFWVVLTRSELRRRCSQTI